MEISEPSETHLVNQLLGKLQQNTDDNETQAKKQYGLHALIVFVENLYVIPPTVIQDYKIKKDHGVIYNSYLTAFGEAFIDEFLAYIGYDYIDSDQAFALRRTPTEEDVEKCKSLIRLLRQSIEKNLSSFLPGFELTLNELKIDTEPLDTMPKGTLKAAESLPNNDDHASFSLDEEIQIDEKYFSLETMSELDSNSISIMTPIAAHNCSDPLCEGEMKFDLCTKCHRCSNCFHQSNEMCETCRRNQKLDQWICFHCNEAVSYGTECDKDFICCYCYLHVLKNMQFCANCKTEVGLAK